MKKVLSLVLATMLVLSLASVAAFAAVLSKDTAYDGDGEPSKDVGSGSGSNIKAGWDYDNLSFASAMSLVIEDRVTPGSTFYIPLGTMTAKTVANAIGTDNQIVVGDLTEKDYFNFKVDKDTNSKLVKSITVVGDKAMNGMSRAAYLKVELNDSTTTDEQKTSGTITFKAKNDLGSYHSKSSKPQSYLAPAGGQAGDPAHLAANKAVWAKDDILTINYSFWVNNIKAGNDDNPGAGDRVFFDPDKNDTNTLIWDEDRAALRFEANDDANKFYCRLSTANMSDIYSEYGDPVDADLWFYDFVSHPTVPSTSRATLTLGVPWDDDENVYAAPEDCYIYQLNDDDTLVDVTSSFSYSEDAEEIPGWSIKTRQLGTYIVSDTELEIDVYEDEPDDVPSEEPTVKPDKDIPNTGSSDMVNVAVVAAVVSLAAAGAVAFRKVK